MRYVFGALDGRCRGSKIIPGNHIHKTSAVEMRNWVLLAVAVLLWSCGGSDKPKVAVAQPPAAPAPAVAPAAGPAAAPETILVTDPNGMTIYYHDRDEPNKSQCNESCSRYWFPVRPNPEVSTGSSFGEITRTDGTRQVTFEGRPLYTFFDDKKPGDTKGDGKQGIWHALRY